MPVFIISSSRNPEDLRRAQALNVAGFFQKPIDMTDFESLALELVTRQFPKHVGRVPGLKTEAPVASSEEKRTLANGATRSELLLSREGLFRQLVEAVKDYAIFMVDPHGIILTWNDGAERIKGYQASEIIGKHFSIFYPREANEEHHPTYELETAAKVGRFQEEGWRIRKDGTRFWASVTITAMRNKAGELLGFGKVTRDFSERREAERTLIETERRFRLLVEEVKDYAIFMLSPEGIISSWNLGAERIKGYKAPEVLGRHFSIFYPQEAIEKKHPENELKLARENGAYEKEGLRLRKDGSTFWASVVITALYDEERKLQGFSKVTRDITDKKRTEEEREKFAARLEEKVKERTAELELSKKEILHQRDQLARSNADLQQFAYVASHDLQEPLRTIVTSLQLIEKEFLSILPPEMLEYMNFAIEGSQKMRGLIEGLLLYGRVGQSLHIETKVDFNRILQEVMHGLKTSIDESHAEIDVRELPKIAADATMMKQVFQNLLSNAIKYRGDEPLKVAVSAERKENEWVFCVQDNGIGIAPQYFERIFVIFQRLHGNREKYSGTGLGLAIVKRVLEAHRGRTWVDSEPGKGSSFYFSLPNEPA